MMEMDAVHGHKTIGMKRCATVEPFLLRLALHDHTFNVLLGLVIIQMMTYQMSTNFVSTILKVV